MNSTDLQSYARLKTRMEVDPGLAIFKEIEAIKSQLNAVLEAQITQLKNDFSGLIDKEVGGVLERIMEVEKQEGPAGHTPTKQELLEIIEPLIVIPDPIKGDPGKNYVLTEKDKKDIADKITVPIVEKVIVEKRTQIIKEQPIITNLVTNEVKEVVVAETALKIADKLNTEKEIVERKVVKGLDNDINYIRRGLHELQRKKGGGGGGGIGQAQVQTFDVNATTTTLTLTYAPTGRAILAFYQGQYLVPSTGYTISGKTITLLFTPMDGTFIDVWLIR